jgi:hypothetical protein
VSMAVNRSDGERDDAYRVKKLVQNGVAASQLSAREFGLLYLHYPELLPDVFPEVVER